MYILYSSIWSYLKHASNSLFEMGFIISHHAFFFASLYTPQWGEILYKSVFKFCSNTLKFSQNLLSNNIKHYDHQIQQPVPKLSILNFITVELYTTTKIICHASLLPVVYIHFTYFLKFIYVLWPLALCMVSIQERVIVARVRYFNLPSSFLTLVAKAAI
jgi:hypothetical protein